jgi:hypothetical protein
MNTYKVTFSNWIIPCFRCVVNADSESQAILTAYEIALSQNTKFSEDIWTRIKIKK